MAAKKVEESLESRKALIADKQRVAQLTATFGQNMRSERKARGFSSDVLADYLGISAAYVGLIERGERCPSLDTFLRICEFFGETAEHMVNIQPSPFVLNEVDATTGQGKTGPLHEKKVKTIASMVAAFTDDQLDHVVDILQILRDFGRINMGRAAIAFDTGDDTE